MDTLSRKTVNFDQQDSPVVAPFLDASTSERAALEALVGQPLSSDSAELRALVLLGVRHVREALLEDAYNDAVDAGESTAHATGFGRHGRGAAPAPDGRPRDHAQFGVALPLPRHR